jgi:hypothetical protein
MGMPPVIYPKYQAAKDLDNGAEQTGIAFREAMS